MEEKLKLLAYLEAFITAERKQKFEEILSQRSKHLTIAVEDVYQKHNTSALLRSCDVFGVQEAHIVELKNSSVLDKNIAMGAEQWVDTVTYSSTSDCIANLKAKGYQVIATTPNNDSSFVKDFDVNQKTALFFGTERDGLSEEVMQKADGFLKIPMIGFTQSLNVSVSAAVILFELSQKLRSSDIAWQLTAQEKLNIQLDWTKKSIQSIEYILDRYQKENSK